MSKESNVWSVTKEKIVSDDPCDGMKQRMKQSEARKKQVISEREASRGKSKLPIVFESDKCVK